ncbi:MAG: molybdopterin-dependent oxidoreductase [Candidatus Promineifilaceae bacterium]
MRHPWANVALLILLLAQVVTGYLGFTNGAIERRWLLWLHGAGAYAIVLILLWKGAIILDVYGRLSRFGWRRLSFALLLALLIVTLLTGLLWTYGGPIYALGLSLVTLHIFAAVALIVLAGYHLWHYRWMLRHPKATGRRAFLNLGGVALAGLGVWWAAGRLKGGLALPGDERRFTGSYETGSGSGVFPVVSWIADRPPPVDPAGWRLVVDGQVSQRLELSYADVLALPAAELEVVLDCTGGWYSRQLWRGPRLADLLNLARPGQAAASLTIEAVSGYQRRFTLAEAGGYLLATHVAGAPLEHGHGFPLRLVAAGQRGVHWVKWISHIRLNQTPKWLQLPLPVQ